MERPARDPIVVHNGRRYHFQFESTYLSETHWSVDIDRKPVGRICLKSSISDHERATLKPDAIKCVESSLGILRSIGGDAPDQDMVDAFNAWRERERGKILEFMKSQPEIYGDVSDITVTPAAVVGRFNGTTWEKIE